MNYRFIIDSIEFDIRSDEVTPVTVYFKTFANLDILVKFSFKYAGHLKSGKCLYNCIIGYTIGTYKEISPIEYKQFESVMDKRFKGNNNIVNDIFRPTNTLIEYLLEVFPLNYTERKKIYVRKTRKGAKAGFIVSDGAFELILEEPNA